MNDVHAVQVVDSAEHLENMLLFEPTVRQLLVNKFPLKKLNRTKDHNKTQDRGEEKTRLYLSGHHLRLIFRHVTGQRSKEDVEIPVTLGHDHVYNEIPTSIAVAEVVEDVVKPTKETHAPHTAKQKEN